MCSPSEAQQIFRPNSTMAIAPAIVLQDLQQAQVVYLGETHDHAADHQAQLTIIQSLHQPHRNLAIALEIFQRPFQPVIDDYLAGKITEAELVEKTEYQQRWGFPWENYAPILRYAQQHQIRVLAINTPTEITRKVARQGLDSLTSAERQQIPPLSEIRIEPPEYRQRLLEVFEQHQTSGVGAAEKFERFFQAQVLWDETMAEAIANFIQTHPDYQVVAIAGQGHIIGGYGIPSRVARRIQHSPFQQRLILLNPSKNHLSSSPTPLADYLWISPNPQSFH